VEYKVDIEGVADTVRQLRNIQPELYKKMTAEIKNEPGLKDAISAIKSRIPTISPLQGNEFGYGGMIHNGRTSYRPPKVGVSFRPSVKLRGSAEKSLVTIVTSTPSDAVGFEIIDLVGRGKNAGTPKARGMIRKLGGTPSRYVWKGFEERKEGIQKAVVAIIDRYSQIVNVKLRTK
jgi:hypothetical protein